MNSTRSGLLLLAALLLAAAPAVAQTTIAGDWDLTIQSPQGANTVRVSIKQDGEKVSGTLKSPQGEVPFEGGALTGTDIKVSFSVPFQGAPLEITLTGKVDGPTAAGIADFGGFAQGDWIAKRVDASAAAASAAPAAAAVPAVAAAPALPAAAAAGLSGRWEITLQTERGEVPATADLTDVSGTITGTLTGPAGPMNVTGTFDGSSIRIAFTASTPNGDIPVTMTGDVTGDSIAGKAEFGGMGNGAWSAKRARP